VYGNVILSRFPCASTRLRSTAFSPEPALVSRCDLEIAPGKIVHLFNVHWAGIYASAQEARLLMSREISLSPQLKHPRLSSAISTNGRAAWFQVAAAFG